MEGTEITPAGTAGEGKKGYAKEFLAGTIRGAAMGIAFIIPGFSGGTVAAILGVYEQIINAVTGLFRHFRSSMRVLLPIALGMALGMGALMFPIQWGLANYPLPTVSLFVGLALGGLPPLKSRAGKLTLGRIFSFLAALAAAAALVFLPRSAHAEGFLYRLDFVGYLLLFLVGALASCALVIPGISGSMLLLIFGYYSPLVSLLTGLLRGQEIALGLLVAAVFAAGLAAGFFLISYLMKALLAHFPNGTYAAVLGFILGSVAAVYAPLLNGRISAGAMIAAVLFLLAGAMASAAFVRLAGRRGEGAKRKDG